MDPMVLKYVGLAGLVYGLHAILAIAQLGLSWFLIISGVNLLNQKERVGKWGSRFGLVVDAGRAGSRREGWMMIVAGVLLLLPILGLSYWFAVIGCALGIARLLQLTKGQVAGDGSRMGGLVRKGLLVGAVLVFGATLWEKKDLVSASAVISAKAAYWEITEVFGWQSSNDPHAPKVGELAPDFELSDLTGTNTVRLSDFRGKKPVVLLFGSFT